MLGLRWVTYEWDEDSARGCDSKGSRVRATMWATGLAAAASIFTAYASAHGHGFRV